MTGSATKRQKTPERKTYEITARSLIDLKMERAGKYAKDANTRGESDFWLMGNYLIARIYPIDRLAWAFDMHFEEHSERLPFLVDILRYLESGSLKAVEDGE